MIQFLKKYWINIILILLFTFLFFGFNPGQEKLYLREDYSTAKRLSNRAILWTMGAGAALIFIIAMRGVKNIRQVGNLVISLAGLSLPVWFIFKIFFLSGFLALNRIELPGSIEKKYTVTNLGETGQVKPLIYDCQSEKILIADKIGGMEKLDHLHSGDTITIAFHKGLMGVPFKPVIK